MPNISLSIAQAQAGDEKVLERLVQDNMGLVAKIVQRYTRYGTNQESEDLMQVGSMGLLKAIRNFDLTLGYKFSTYAFPCILGEIKRYLEKQTPYKISKDIYLLGKELRHKIQEEKNNTGEDLKISEIIKKMGISLEEAVLAMEANQQPLSLEATLQEGSTSRLYDVIGQEEIQLDRLSVQEAINDLDKRSKHLIFLRYFRGLTQEQTGTELGLSQVHVSRLEKKIIEQMKFCLEG